MINRNLHIPLYYQLMEKIKNQIESGELKPGDTIPKEVELTNLYDISRATVHQSISHLINEGYLRRVKSKGVFVSVLSEKPKFVGTLKGFAKEMNEKGIPFSTKVIKKHIIHSPIKVAEKLEIASGDKVFHLHRLRFVKGKPLVISHSYISIQLCRNIENINFEKNSLYNVLEHEYKIFLHHGQRFFEAALAYSEEEVKLLDVPLKTPFLYMSSTTYTKSNIPVEYVEMKMRGKFMVDLIQT